MARPGRWRRLGWALAATVLLLGALAVLRPGSETSSEAREVEAAREALQPFKTQLMAALKSGLERGPEAAIDACRLEAPRIAASLTSDTIRVGRTSHRLRNPANAPRPWMVPILEELRESRPGAIEYRLAPAAPGWEGYAEPIYVQPLCLTCHGEQIAEPIRERLRVGYPEDRATGFAVGDFRGLFWVERKADGGGT